MAIGGQTPQQSGMLAALIDPRDHAPVMALKRLRCVRNRRPVALPP